MGARETGERTSPEVVAVPSSKTNAPKPARPCEIDIDGHVVGMLHAHASARIEVDRLRVHRREAGRGRPDNAVVSPARCASSSSAGAEVEMALARQPEPSTRRPHTSAYDGRGFPRGIDRASISAVALRSLAVAMVVTHGVR